MMVHADKILDAKGLACPMPIVRTKKAFQDLSPGEVLEVQATDKGSIADLQAWAKSAGHQYIGLIEEGTILKHYLRKSSGADAQEKKHPHVISNEELQQILASNQPITLLDVREEAEFSFGHVPGALSIPLGKLEGRLNELNNETTIYVICRTGNRSDLAAQLLTEKGFPHVVNVVPGMSAWDGVVE
nr:sulfurtransferase TusA family protein [Bacillus kwashiorkori]